MTNRREFLQIGISATAWPIASSAARAAGADIGPSGTLPINKLVYDKRFGDSLVFARRAEQLGLRTRAIEGDMTRLWYDEIYHDWKERPSAIAGLTAHGPMFCFDVLARDHGMRVVFKVEHSAGDANTVSHALSGPETMLSDCASLPLAGSRWAAHMADVVSRCPSGRMEITRTHLVSHKADSRFDDDSLFTWIIAPAAEA